MEIELSEHSHADYEYQNTVATVISVARRAKYIFEQSSDIVGKRAFLNYLLQNPTVLEKTLGFTLRSPLNLVLELLGSPTYIFAELYKIYPLIKLSMEKMNRLHVSHTV